MCFGYNELFWVLNTLNPDPFSCRHNIWQMWLEDFKISGAFKRWFKVYYCYNINISRRQRLYKCLDILTISWKICQHDCFLCSFVGHFGPEQENTVFIKLSLLQIKGIKGFYLLNPKLNYIPSKNKVGKFTF